MYFEIDDSKRLIKVSLLPSEKEVIVPHGVVSIGEGAFKGFTDIEIVRLPRSIKRIEDQAFYNCFKLKKINIPESVSYIGDSAFSCCSSLENIELPSNLESVGRNAFYLAKKLSKVVINDGLEMIGANMFNWCESLEEIIIPNSVKEIKEGAFQRCNNLQKVSIGSNVERIGEYAFKACSNLKNIKLPNSLKTIGTGAFCECLSLEEIAIPPYVENLGSAFINRSPIKRIEVGNFSQLYQLGFNNLFMKENYYFNENDGSILILDKPMVEFQEWKKIEFKHLDGIKTQTKVDSIIIGAIFSREEINKLGSSKSILPFLVVSNIDKDNYKEIKQKIFNSKEFNGVLKKITSLGLTDEPSVCYDLFKFAYAVGAFNDNKVERQKACEFIINAFDKNWIKVENMHMMFQTLKFRDFSKDLSEFILNNENFCKLMKIDNDQEGYIARVFNHFEEIREFGRSNKGDQRYRKVTIDMCKEFLSTPNFGEVVGYEDIAKELVKFTRKQESFDEAVEIRKKYLELKEKDEIEDYILGEELKLDSFSKISDIQKEILDDTSIVLNDLAELASDNFSVEFLSKYDPLNFTLGKYCSCCSHIEGSGKGIVKATIIHPDCQNMIIRDSDGRIVAKSTLYVNRKQGYAVFNNVEISKNISLDYKEEIYNKYVKMIDLFARKYNEKYPDNPIRQVNVGMRMNDLKEQIKANNDKSKDILTSLDFSKYGGYEGDWYESQYVVWSIERETVKKI